MSAAGDGRTRLWRLGAVLLFCGAPLLLAGLSVADLTRAAAARALAAQQGATLSQIVALVAKHRARGLAPNGAASLYLASTSASLARSELQETATRLATAAGGQLVEAQFTSTPEQEADGTVAIQLDLDIANKGLFDLLWAVESRLPVLEVTDLSARRNGDQNSEGGAAAGDLLHVDLTVQGRWKKGTG